MKLRDWVPDAIDFQYTAAGRFADNEVVKEFSDYRGEWQPHPFVEKHVHKWCILDNGYAVGVNEGTNGYSYPYKKFKLWGEKMRIGQEEWEEQEMLKEQLEREELERAWEEKEIHEHTPPPRKEKKKRLGGRMFKQINNDMAFQEALFDVIENLRSIEKTKPCTYTSRDLDELYNILDQSCSVLQDAKMYISSCASKRKIGQSKFKGPRAEEFAKAIEDYTGEKVLSIEVVADPQVSGTLAAQAKMKGIGYPFQFIYIGHEGPLDWQHIGEADFKTWPPISGKLKFFV